MCLIALTGACATESAARRFVAQRNVCPPERIQVRERPDVDAMSFLAATVGAPSPDIAGDPERLAYWKRTVVAPQASALQSTTVYEVSGCQAHGLVGCRPTGKNGPSCEWLPGGEKRVWDEEQARLPRSH